MKLKKRGKQLREKSKRKNNKKMPNSQIITFGGQLIRIAKLIQISYWMIFNKTVMWKQKSSLKNNKIMYRLRNQRKKNRNQNDARIHSYS